MAEGNKSLPLKRRHRVNPKRGVRPRVLARADRLVTWGASIVIVVFLAIVAVQAVLG